MSSPYLCVQMHIMQVYLLKICSCVCVNAKAVVACQPTPFPLPVISSGMQALEHEGEHRFPPHWGCQSSPLVSCRHSGSRQASIRGERGRHRTYDNNSGNKFGKWGTHWPIGITPSLTLTMLGRGVVCFCLHERERDTETDKKHLRQREKGKRG